MTETNFPPEISNFPKTGIADESTGARLQTPQDNTISSGSGKPDYYRKNNLLQTIKEYWFLVLFAVGAISFLIYKVLIPLNSLDFRVKAIEDLNEKNNPIIEKLNENSNFWQKLIDSGYLNKNVDNGKTNATESK